MSIVQVSKKIMNPVRIKQLQIIKDAGEVNANFVSYRSGKTTEQTNLSLQRFAELGLIRYTGGGYCEISELGEAYLQQLEESGTPILKTIVTQQEREKYVEAVELLYPMDSGLEISVSFLQRRLRIGYGTATAILHTLVKEGYVEMEEGWVGFSVNGAKTEGQTIKQFKTAKNPVAVEKYRETVGDKYKITHYAFKTADGSYVEDYDLNHEPPILKTTQDIAHAYQLINQRVALSIAKDMNCTVETV